MRSLWLASAAIIMTAGIAAAQTSSPAPTGAPGAPPESSNPNASPGNMGTQGNNKAGPAIVMSAPSAGAVAPTGAPQAPESSPNPAISPGNMAPSGSTSPTPPAPPPHPMSAVDGPKGEHMNGHMAMPEEASAERYLHIAADAIRHHNKAMADEALGHAETRMLTRAVPASGGAMADQSPRVTAVEHARQALAQGDFHQAAMDTRMAMGPGHGPMHSPMGGSSAGSGK